MRCKVQLSPCLGGWPEQSSPCLQQLSLFMPWLCHWVLHHRKVNTAQSWWIQAVLMLFLWSHSPCTGGECVQSVHALWCHVEIEKAAGNPNRINHLPPFNTIKWLKLVSLLQSGGVKEGIITHFNILYLSLGLPARGTWRWREVEKQLPGARVSFRSRSSNSTALGAVLPAAKCPTPQRCKGGGKYKFESSKSHGSRGKINTS